MRISIRSEHIVFSLGIMLGVFSKKLINTGYGSIIFVILLAGFYLLISYVYNKDIKQIEISSKRIKKTYNK